MVSSSQFAPYPGFLVEHPMTADIAFYLLYFTIFVLSVIVYKLGFAKKLPILKSVIIYFFMLVGCYILSILALLIPITGALFFSAIVLGIYKFRLKAAQKKENSQA